MFKRKELGGKFARAICPGKACVWKILIWHVQAVQALSPRCITYSFLALLSAQTECLPKPPVPTRPVAERCSACDAALTSAVSVPVRRGFKVGCRHQLFSFAKRFPRLPGQRPLL